jgi:hypothetical protein
VHARTSIALAFAFALLPCRLAFAADPSQEIAVITGAQEKTRDAFAAGKKLASQSAKGTYRHIVLGPDAFSDSGKAQKAITDIALDPKVKAVIVSPAPSGCAVAFSMARQKRPELICVALDPWENDLLIESSADLVISTDVVSRAVRLALVARQFGIARILYASGMPSFPSETDKRFLTVLAAACGDMGIELIQKDSRQGAQAFLDQQLAQTDVKSLLWCSERLSPESMRAYLSQGGYFLESPQPNLVDDFSAIFSVDSKTDGAEYQKILKKYEKAAIDSNMAGHVGSWIFPEPYALTMGMAEFLRENPGTKLSTRDQAAILEEISAHCPGTKATLASKVDPSSGVKCRNHYFFKENLYLLGKGFISVTAQEIPEKYQRLGN